LHYVSGEIEAFASGGWVAYLVIVRRHDAHRTPTHTIPEKTIMPDITVKQIDELERYTGAFQKGQQFFFAGKSLGLSKLGMNALRMPPRWEHYPEHDHAADNEEELYIPLEGSGTLHVQGQTYAMHRGVLIRVGAATKRKIVPGPEGMTLLMLSDRPDSK
jgi:mannose-6-phosphate isomerase-like protein (cupin superfamily)